MAGPWDGFFEQLANRAGDSGTYMYPTNTPKSKYAKYTWNEENRNVGFPNGAGSSPEYTKALLERGFSQADIDGPMSENSSSRRAHDLDPIAHPGAPPTEMNQPARYDWQRAIYGSGPSSPEALEAAAGKRVGNSDIASAHQARKALAVFQNASNQQQQYGGGGQQQQGGQQQRGGNRSTPQNVWDQAMPAQMADLVQDPANLGRQMQGASQQIGQGLQAAADRMTEAGIGPLAPYSEKNPGPYNYMGPAMYGGESRENLEKRAMGPFSQFFGDGQMPRSAGMPGFGGGQSPTPYYYPQGGGMSVQNGVGAFAPWDMDIEKQKAMDVYKRQKWDQDGPMRTQMLQQYAPLWNQIFGGGGGGQYRAPNYRLNFGNQQASGPQPPQWG